MNAVAYLKKRFSTDCRYSQCCPDLKKNAIEILAGIDQSDIQFRPFINGELTDDDSALPWQLALKKALVGEKRTVYDYEAAAVLIHVDATGRCFALTAAHNFNAVPEFADKKMYISGGGVNFNKHSKTWVCDLLYDFRPVADLAIIEFYAKKRPDFFEPIEIASWGISKFLRSKPNCCLVSGWGIQNKNLANDKFLRDAVMYVCEDDSLDCVYFTCKSIDRQGPCSNDSGGPLVSIYNKKPLLLGILKGNKNGGCHSNEDPVRFVNVALFRKTIYHIIDSRNEQQ